MTQRVSNEVYSFGIKSKLAIVLQPHIEKMCTFYREFGTLDDKDVDKLTNILHTQTGITFTTTINPTKGIIAAINLSTLENHYGSRIFPAMMTMVSEKGFKSVISVDVDNLFVSGDMVKMFNMTLYLSYGVFELYMNDPRQIVSFILHETGHAFNFFLGLGDYVYLNYMLTDGVEILMERKKPNKTITIVDHTFLTKTIEDPKERHEYMNNRTEEMVRNVVLSSLRTHPRPYLFYGTKNDIKRDEQLADVLPTRLGYGKDLALALLTLDKTEGATLFRTKASFWMMELVRLPLVLVGIVPLMVVLFQLGSSISDRYDKPWYRVDRIRRDLIAQLKVVKQPEIKASLVADIEALEKVAEQYSKNEGIVDGLLYFFNRNFRRGHQLDAQERTLESLLNNNMFVLSQKLSQLQK